MPTTDTTVTNLIINKLTKQQYDNIQNPSDTELYLVPDEIDSTPTSGSDNTVTSDGVYTALQDKADKVSSPTNGHLASLDSSGNLADSGYAPSDFITGHQDISGKADKVTGATNGNLAGLDSSGNLTDSGYKASDFLTQHQDISGKADKVANATAGDVATLDSSGNLVDSTYSPSDFVASDQGSANAGKSLVVGNDGTVSPDVAPLSKLTVSIPFGQVDSTSTSTVFTATVDGITELRDGVCCYLRNGVVTSASGWTLNINGLGAKPVYQTLADASRTTTIFNINFTFLFVYNSTRVENGCWDVYYGYNTNDDYRAYIVRTGNLTLPAKFKTYRYRLLFTSADGNYYVGANDSTSTNATDVRTPTTEKIDPFGRIVYYGTTSAVDADANFGTGYLYQQSAFTLGYSFNNTGSALVLEYPKPLYIKCAPQTDGSAIIDATTPYVQSLPSTEDGKIYIFLGIAYSATAVELTLEHPVYYFKGGSIREWTNASETDISGKADKVANATNGNLAGLNSSGNLTDSGYKPADFISAPSTAGTSGQVLTSDGQGGQSWQTPSGGSVTDVQVNGTSVISSNVANIITNTAYSASSNKIATMSDLPSVPVTDVTVGGTSVVSSGVAAVPSIPDVTGKADKVQNATNGNLAGLDSNGNLTDSGSKASDFATAAKAVPTGGTTGQVLAKHSNTNNDVEWVDPNGGYNFAFTIDGNNLKVTYGDAINPNFSITNDHLIVTL